MKPDGHMKFDHSLWPLLLIRYEGILTNPQLIAGLEQRKRYLEQCEPCVVVHDMTRASEMGPFEQRRMQTEWLKAHDAQLRQWVLGVGFVTTSVAMRLIVSLTIRIKPLPMPHQVFARGPEAVLWSAGLLQRAGLKNHHILAQYTAGPHAHAP